MMGFLAAIALGYVTPQLEDMLARPLSEMLRPVLIIEASEMRLFAFMVAMLLAGIVAALFESAIPFWIILGGTLGYFGPRLVAAVRSIVEGKK